MSLEPGASPLGLTREEAARRLASDGPNDLPRPPRRTTGRIAFEVAREPMFQLLAAAVAIYLVLGDLSEASVLLAFVGVIVAITLVQERRTERVLEALHDMTSPRALVWRDGQRERMAGVAVVCGDILELVEGDRVPADARLLEANDLLIDESLLSGESLPVAKRAAAGAIDGPAAASCVYAGTMIVAGQGRAEVTATGARSEIGRIGRVLGAIEPETTPLHRQTRQLVRWFSVLGLAVSAAVAVLYVWTHDDWLGGALAGITMAMSMLPQEFLLILTVFMAMGAWRLSQHRVLTRRAATIEALGAATVLCTDKTGTLTHNRMVVGALVRFEANLPVCWTAVAEPLPEAFHELLSYGILASERHPFDPMERAFHALGDRVLAPLPAGWELVHEYGLASDLPVMSHVWRTEEGAAHRVAAKGAPESIAALCHLPPDQSASVLAEASRLAGRGMRVLGVAAAPWGADAWPVDSRGFAFRFLGLVALADPLRDNVPQAVRECRQAGIRVVMITGDHPGTALAIARQAGIDGESGLLRGDEVAALSDTELRRAVTTTTVFARVAPQQKLRIVEALKANGEVVAMTGDGVNDAPSLKAAHIGIAMGGRGTDVARESASLVLLDDDFGTLVRAVRLGRRIFDNLRKAMRFVFAVHVPIAGLTLLPLMFGWPLLFTPMHIAFLEIVIDPVCSIVFEAEDEEPDVMTRPPRDPLAALFSPGLIAASLWQGVSILLAVAACYGVLLRSGVPEGQARAAAFVALVVSNISLILATRTPRSRWNALLTIRNRALWITLLATLGMLSAVVGVEMLRRLFGFDLPTPATLAAAVAVGLGVLPLLLVQRAMGQSLATRLGWKVV